MDVLFGRKRESLAYIGKGKWITDAVGGLLDGKVVVIRADGKAGLTTALRRLTRADGLRRYELLTCPCSIIKDEESLATTFSNSIDQLVATPGAKENGHYFHRAAIAQNGDAINSVMERLDSAIASLDQTPLLAIDDVQEILDMKSGEALVRKLVKMSNEGQISLVLAEHPTDGKYRLDQFIKRNLVAVSVENLDIRVWYKSLKQQLKRWGIRLKRKHFEWIVEWAENSPGAVVHMLKQCEMAPSVPLRKKTLVEALEDNHALQSAMYESVCKTLARSQLSYLFAMASGEQQLSASGVLEKYGLGTSANSIKIRRALVSRRLIIHRADGSLAFADPFFRSWFKRVFLNESYREQVDELGSFEIDKSD